MVKIHCDRCGAEIKEDYYYTINIGKTDLNPKCDLSVFAEAISACASSTTKKSPFEKLSSQRMYCKSCADDVIYTLNHYTEVL